MTGDPLTAEIAAALRPVLDREADRRASEKAVLLNRPATARDAKIHAACRKVALAVDRHQAALETRGEIGARMAVIRAANELARVMRGGRP